MICHFVALLHRRGRDVCVDCGILIIIIRRMLISAALSVHILQYLQTDVYSMNNVLNYCVYNSIYNIIDSIDSIVL